MISSSVQAWMLLPSFRASSKNLACGVTLHQLVQCHGPKRDGAGAHQGQDQGVHLLSLHHLEVGVRVATKHPPRLLDPPPPAALVRSDVAAKQAYRHPLVIAILPDRVLHIDEAIVTPGRDEPALRSDLDGGVPRNGRSIRCSLSRRTFRLHVFASSRVPQKPPPFFAPACSVRMF